MYIYIYIYLVWTALCFVISSFWSSQNAQSWNQIAPVVWKEFKNKHTRRGARGGPPAEGPPPPPPPWGPGGEGGRLGWGHIRQTIQSPKASYKDPTDYTKPQKDYTKPQEDYTKTQKDYTKPLNIRQNLKISNKYLNYLTRETTNVNSTYNIKYPI